MLPSEKYYMSFPLHVFYAVVLYDVKLIPKKTSPCLRE
jgi:hypothetical protein